MTAPGPENFDWSMVGGARETRLQHSPAKWLKSNLLYVEEINRRVPASYSTEPVAPETIFSEDTFVESGPRFSGRLPFWEVT